MTCEKLTAIARDCGFTNVAPLDVATLKFLPEVRDMCRADRCRSYGRSWSCPPAAGTLEEISAKCAGFSAGIIMQTVGQREDEYDFEAIMETEKAHTAAFRAFTDAVEGEDIFPMGAGACTRCEKCTYPDEPCRFPGKVFPSMEASGLFVSQVCKDNGVAYYYGPNSICFVSCCLFR